MNDTTTSAPFALRVFKLYPGTPTDGPLTAEQAGWLNGSPVGYARHRTPETDFIKRQYRGGLVTPSGHFTRDGTLIHGDGKREHEARAVVDGVSVVTGNPDLAAVVFLDEHGGVADILACIPLKHQVASMLKAKMLTSAEAFQLEPSCPASEVEPEHFIVHSDEYGCFVADLAKARVPAEPPEPAPAPWAAEVDRLERLIMERTTAGRLSANNLSIVDAHLMLAERVLHLEGPQAPTQDAGAWPQALRPRLLCRIFGHTRDTTTTQVDHGTATANCARCDVKLTRIVIPKWVVSSDVGADVRWPRR